MDRLTFSVRRVLIAWIAIFNPFADYLPHGTVFERDNKRSRSIHPDEHWVYQRKRQEADSIPEISPLPRQDVKPVIQVSQPGDENRTIRLPRGNTSDAQPAVPSPLPTILASRTTDSSADNVRRFHLSRSPAPQPSGVVQPRGISKKRGASTLFVERARRKRASDVASLLSEAKRDATDGSGAGKAHEEIKMEDASSEGDLLSKETSRPNKRPGASSRTAPASKPTLPPSLLDRHGVDMDQLAKDMDSYTLSHIHHALELEKERAEKDAQARARAAQRARFRPKAPAQRFAERNPDFVAQVAQGQASKPAHDGMDLDEGASDDEDYVLETYVRVPASQLTETVQPHQVGLLVFDNEPDMEFFYGNDEDSEEEIFLDEDDENGKSSPRAGFVF